ncbi:MAG: cupin domain-containing protein [Burkholderiaceae bacterium]
MTLIDWSTIPTAAGMRAGSTRQAVCAEMMSAVRVETAPDAVFDGKTHWHENEQMLVMISGNITLKIDDRIVECKPGDLVFFPPGSHHAAIGTGPEGAVYYELFAPARPDQLPGWIGKSILKY